MRRPPPCPGTWDGSPRLSTRRPGRSGADRNEPVQLLQRRVRRGHPGGLSFSFAAMGASFGMSICLASDGQRHPQAPLAFTLHVLPSDPSVIRRPALSARSQLAVCRGTRWSRPPVRRQDGRRSVGVVVWPPRLGHRPPAKLDHDVVVLGDEAGRLGGIAIGELSEERAEQLTHLTP
jgi:hypothetical protein